MTTHDPDQPPLRRDLAEDEPDLPDDAELEALAPPLPPLTTEPLDPVPPVLPGPEDVRSPMLVEPKPDSTLESLAERADQAPTLGSEANK